MRNKPRCLKQKVVASTMLFDVEQLSLEFNNGEHRVYERICGRGNGAVLIIPMLDDDHFLLVEEYCAGLDEYQLGFPKGLCEQGENALQAANRELMEEVGMGANTLVELKSISLAPGYFSATMAIVLAKDLYPNQRQGDEPEPLTVVQWSRHKVDDLLNRSDFTESRSIAALFLLEKLLRKGEDDG